MGGINKKKNKNRIKRKNRQNAERIHHNDQDKEDKSERFDDKEDEEDPLIGNEVDESGIASRNSSLKRQLENVNESDDEDDKPKKKKKKKPPVVSESTDKKGKKSIRQLKREKFAERQAEAQAVAKNELKSQCQNYLSQWKHDKQNWKFMKAKQVWLYKNKFSSNLVPDSSWPLLLEYFESAQGNIRKMLLDDSKKVIQQMDEWTESQTEQDTKDADTEETEETNEDSETAPKNKKPDENVYKRARDLLQCLEE